MLLDGLLIHNFFRPESQASLALHLHAAQFQANVLVELYALDVNLRHINLFMLEVTHVAKDRQWTYYCCLKHLRRPAARAANSIHFAIYS